jgi:hypothetical protein
MDGNEMKICTSLGASCADLSHSSEQASRPNADTSLNGFGTEREGQPIHARASGHSWGDLARKTSERSSICASLGFIVAPGSVKENVTSNGNR